MATLNTAGAATGGSVFSEDATAPNKASPHLHSVASSLRSCLDGMLPDNLRNETEAFDEHLDQQKTKLQAEKNSWRFGLNYLFETLKKHKDWHARNQQYVQLGKDVRKCEEHVASLRSVLTESASALDLESGMRGAELEGRVGAYKVLFEVTKIVSSLSRPTVKLQTLKPDASSLSIYCDTFVLDIVLSGGEGAVESATLQTVEKDQSKQFQDRDQDLLQSLRLLAAGESSSFTDKLTRLINRAELAVKYPSTNFEQAEEDLYNKITQAFEHQTYWTAKRAVDGIAIEFRDSLCCPAVEDRPLKKARTPATTEPSTDVTDGVMLGTEEDESADKSISTALLLQGKWSGSISFIEWGGQLALHVVGTEPLVMSNAQTRKLALTTLKGSGGQGEDKSFNEFVSWTTRDGQKPISQHPHFVNADKSSHVVSPPNEVRAMRQEFALATKETSGALRLDSFPIPLANVSMETVTEVFQVCGQNLLFHSMLLSVFGMKQSIYGRDGGTADEAPLKLAFDVDVAAPERITFKTSTVLDKEKSIVVEAEVAEDCSVDMNVKAVNAGSEGQHENGVDSIEDSSKISLLASTCHSIPLLLFYGLKRVLQDKAGDLSTLGVEEDVTQYDEIQSLDDLSGSVKLEGEDVLLEDMGMY